MALKGLSAMTVYVLGDDNDQVLAASKSVKFASPWHSLFQRLASLFHTQL